MKHSWGRRVFEGGLPALGPSIPPLAASGLVSSGWYLQYVLDLFIQLLRFFAVHSSSHCCSMTWAELSWAELSWPGSTWLFLYFRFILYYLLCSIARWQQAIERMNWNEKNEKNEMKRILIPNTRPCMYVPGFYWLICAAGSTHQTDSDSLSANRKPWCGWAFHLFSRPPEIGWREAGAPVHTVSVRIHCTVPEQII